VQRSIAKYFSAVGPSHHRCVLCFLRRELGYERDASLAPTIGEDTEMSLRVNPTSVHGIIDYAAAGALYATLALLELGDVPESAHTLRLASGAAVASSLVTDYEVGVVKVVCPCRCT
jgi:hypothetical protein